MYYRLTHIATPDRNQRGDSILNGNRPLNIGQGGSFDIMLPDPGKYEPQLLATVLPNDSGDGWLVAKRTDCHDVLVNGKPLTIAQALADGDIIEFPDEGGTTQLKFNIFNDGDYDSALGVVYTKHKSQGRLVTLVAALALIAVSLASVALFRYRTSLSHSGLNRYCESVYQIVTDSVSLLCDTVVDGVRQQVTIEAVGLDNVAVGTCFLTKDGDFVTARHCIEPWIDDMEWRGRLNDDAIPPEVRLAVVAETQNKLAGREKYKLRSHCVILKGLYREAYYSTDFTVDKSRDLVVRLGRSGSRYYWRTIMPIARRRDMELGDIACVKAKGDVPESKIELASTADLTKYASQDDDRDIAVIGFPLTDVEDDGDEAKPIYGNTMSMSFNSQDSTFIGCMQMSAPINRGNSGGPVFAKIGSTIKAIGIVSKVDGHADRGVFWAVPVTEAKTVESSDISSK